MWWQPGDPEVERGNQAVSGNLGLRDNFLLVLSHTSCLSAMPTLFYSHKNAICHETASFMRTMESKRESRVFPLHIKQSRRCQNMRTLDTFAWTHLQWWRVCAVWRWVFTLTLSVWAWKKSGWRPASPGRRTEHAASCGCSLGPSCCRGSVDAAGEACGDGAAAAVGARAGSYRTARYGRESGGERGETLAFLQGSCSLRS